MFNDLYLKFADEAEANAMLYTTREEPVYELVSVDGEFDPVWIYKDSYGNLVEKDVQLSPEDMDDLELVFIETGLQPRMQNTQTGTKTVAQPNYRNIDVLGVIYNNTDPENPVVIPGWHVNLRLVDDEDGTALEPFCVIPTNPRRVWA